MSRAVDSHGSVRRLGMFLAYLSNRHSASGTVVIVVKGGGQSALEDAGYIALSEAVENVLFLIQV